MTPTQEAPVAPPDEQVPPAAAETTEPVETESQPAAAAPTEDPEVKKLRDRLAEQGRRNAEAQRLALAQAAELSSLKNELGQISQYLSQQQVAAQKAQLAGMEPEQQIAYLSDQLFRLQNQPARVVQTPVQQTAQSIDPRVSAAVDEINTEFGLDDDPITAEEVGWHPTEDAWRKAATLIAKAKTKEVPAKPKVESKTPALTEEQIIERAAQKIRQEMGIGRPNAASPTGAAKSGMTIEGLNKMAANPNLSPRARAEAMRKLQDA